MAKTNNKNDVYFKMDVPLFGNVIERSVKRKPDGSLWVFLMRQDTGKIVENENYHKELKIWTKRNDSIVQEERKEIEDDREALVTYSERLQKYYSLPWLERKTKKPPIMISIRVYGAMFRRSLYRFEEPPQKFKRVYEDGWVRFTSLEKEIKNKTI